MKPLSIKRRRTYLGFFALIFLVCIPILILYATGYRFTDTFKIIKTGGLFIAVPESGAEVIIGDEIIKQTGVFQKNIFVQNLKPGSYEISVKKEGFQSWSKRLLVFPQTVSEAHSFMLPEKVNILEIERYVPVIINGTTTGAVNKKQETSEYKTALAVFTATSTTKLATTSDVIKVNRKLAVTNDKGEVFVEWTGSIESIPYYFCVNQACQDKINVTTKSPVKTFDFFPGRDDILIVALSDGIYVIEIDNRSAQNIQTLMIGEGLDFRIRNDETIFIKQGSNLFTVSF